jgi:ubiquinone/menaquinone biosynthesis C-methylase UbiE
MTTSFDRSIFKNGEYVEYFQPQDSSNPFHKIYERKRVETLAAARVILADRPDARALDIGGGMGRIAVPLAMTHNVILCDISESMLNLARAAAVSSSAATRLQTQVVDASQPLPYGDQSFDLIVCLDLLVHLPDPQTALHELFRTLKPGGKAIIDNSNSVPLWTLFYPSYVGRRPSRWVRTMRAGGVLPEWADIVHHHTRAEFLQMLSSAGFEALQERHYGPAICPKWQVVVACRPPQEELSSRV